MQFSIRHLFALTFTCASALGMLTLMGFELDALGESLAGSIKDFFKYAWWVMRAAAMSDVSMPDEYQIRRSFGGFIGFVVGIIIVCVVWIVIMVVLIILNLSLWGYDDRPKRPNVNPAYLPKMTKVPTMPKPEDVITWAIFRRCLNRGLAVDHTRPREAYSDPRIQVLAMQIKAKYAEIAEIRAEVAAQARLEGDTEPDPVENPCDVGGEPQPGET